MSPGYVRSGLTGSAPEELIAAVVEKIPMRYAMPFILFYRAQSTLFYWLTSFISRIGECEELKGAYLYLASNASSYTTGADLIVDGGYCLL